MRSRFFTHSLSYKHQHIVQRSSPVKYSIFLLFMLSTVAVKGWCQLIVKQGSQVTGGHSSIAINGDLLNYSSGTQLEETILFMTGQSSALYSASHLLVNELTVATNGEVSVSGIWEVTNKLSFENGIVKPLADTENNRIIYSGTLPIAANTQAYVAGPFYNRGSGNRFFPIGTSSGYYPAILEAVNEPDALVGMEVVDDNAAIHLTETTADVSDYLTERYWRILENSNFSSSTIGISLNGAFDYATMGTIILEAPGVGGIGRNLEFSLLTADFIFSRLAARAGNIYTLGRSGISGVTVHNMITPNADGENDRLYISNIHAYASNDVMLMNRWGVVVTRWKNYNNTTTLFDFATLEPGSYVCLVKIQKPDGSTQKISQMVTVLK